MKIAILGFGAEGKAVLKYLKGSKKFRSSEIFILDKNSELRLPRGTKGVLGADYLSALNSFDIVFRSPGVHYDAPELQAARKKGVKFSSATKLFFDEAAKRKDLKVIGVTGTKGKGTTSTLIHKILRSAKKNAVIAGNIGTPAVSILPKLKKGSYVILELSSFQLQDLSRSPKVAAVLEVFPDHQDSHSDLEEYYSAKANIAKHQGSSDAVFFFGDQKMSVKTARPGKGKKNPVFPAGFSEFDPAELMIKGEHNFRNAVLAFHVAEYLKIPKKVIIRTIKNFRGLEHRLEFVAEIGNVSFYNDSASTNPQTSSAAIRSFPGEKLAVILGGYDKGLDYSPLAKTISEVKPLIALCGANSPKIYEAIKGTGVRVLFSKDLETAVRSSYLEFADRPESAVIVLSPGAASFDMFRNYAHRGEEFRRIVKELKDK